ARHRRRSRDVRRPRRRRAHRAAARRRTAHDPALFPVLMTGMNTLLLLLLDSRAPAGAQHHSGGMEAAVGTGLVTGLAGLAHFCRARSRPSARVAAAFAAASCRLQSDVSERALVPAPGPWALLDAELDARTPSEAMRAASRQLGRGLIRLIGSVLPEADLVT